MKNIFFIILASGGGGGGGGGWGGGGVALQAFSKNATMQCKIFWIQIRSNVLSGLIWVKLYKKDQQQTTKELCAHYEL